MEGLEDLDGLEAGDRFKCVVLTGLQEMSKNCVLVVSTIGRTTGTGSGQAAG